MIRTALFAAVTAASIVALAGCTSTTEPQAAETPSPVVEETSTPAPVDTPEPTEDAESVDEPTPDGHDTGGRDWARTRFDIVLAPGEGDGMRVSGE